MFGNFVAEFDDLVSEYFSKYISLSKVIGGLVQEQSELVQKAVYAQRNYIDQASVTKKPDDGQIINLLKPTSELIIQIQSIRDKNRKDEQFNHLSAVAEGITALGWVTVAPTPAPYVKEMIDSAQFYTNKVLVAFKEKDPSHVNWAKSWIEFLSQLQTYVRKHHTTGLVWNPKGNVLNSNSGCAPPPPPPPAGFFDEALSSNNTPKQSNNDSRAALFSAINKGTEITKGLRKVGQDQMTHKNPSLRQSSFVPDRKGNVVSTTICSQPVKRPPKFELEGKKWIIENQIGNASLVLSDTSMSQSVNIFNCVDSMITVKGKVNSITVNQCKKVSLVFDNIVAVVEFINSQRLQTQANGVVPTITIDKVDGIEVYLGKESLACEIVSSKSSEINISVQDQSGEYVEHPIPEQFKSIWNENGFKTVAIDKN